MCWPSAPSSSSAAKFLPSRRTNSICQFALANTFSKRLRLETSRVKQWHCVDRDVLRRSIFAKKPPRDSSLFSPCVLGGRWHPQTIRSGVIQTGFGDATALIVNCFRMRCDLVTDPPGLGSPISKKNFVWISHRLLVGFLMCVRLLISSRLIGFPQFIDFCLISVGILRGCTNYSANFLSDCRRGGHREKSCVKIT